MSVDTRTPRTPTGDRSSAFDDVPPLSMVKVPSDPAQVIVNHASFRVQLKTASRAQSPRAARYLSSGGDTARPAAGAPAGARRRAPVIWSGKSAPDDTGATRLLQAARSTSLRHGAAVPVGDGGSTQVIPRVGDGSGFDVDATVETPSVRPGPLLPQMRSAGSAYEEVDETPYTAGEFEDDSYDDSYDDAYRDDDDSLRRHGAGPVRHGYYPGRRMNLGVVLLPLRVFLGFISIYAGMGKLCDPVYFDGGERGSMVKWLNSLHPWELAEPLREFALQHPIGAGLLIAFFQVIVGVLTVLGLWQRVAAVVGAALSAALLLTVSWKSVPVYDAPDIIYLAAWSPLIIAGAPVYSVDGRLAGEAWRTLGPRAEIWDLRSRVLRRGAVVATVVVGLTLLIGSLLGGAVRDADRVVVPGPGEAPRNELPGSPLPQEPGERREKQSPSASVPPTREAGTASPSGAATTPGATRETATAGAGAGQPSQTQGAAGQAPPQQSAPPQAPATSAGPSSSGGTTGGTAPGGPGGGGSPSGGSGGGSGSGGSGLVGGLLG
ncbi:membrane protein [Streptomyces fructofermentans]|uniref:Membrane protein n=1 Tax=Streptomyces fructofermentans TaxID=152141 RepID=A0A918K4F8_9ACTN|nr:membrane protein [Streptomyces fructofermentans]